MTYYPQARGGGMTYHRPWAQTAYTTNSRNGAALARKAGKHWLDIDACRLKGGLLINDHGSPLHAYFAKGTRSVQFTWGQVKNRIYRHGGQAFRLRTIAAALKDNAAHGVASEVEIKGLGPITQVMLERIMERLAADAHAAYGEAWHARVIIKVLTDLAGGTPYALRICEAAHAVGLQTMILARGKARYNRFAGHTEVTYVRGSAVIR